VLLISDAAATVAVPTGPVDDAPDAPARFGTATRLPGDAPALLATIAGFASDADTIPGLMAAHLQVAYNTLTIAATDRYQLATVDIPVPGSADAAPVLVPAAMVKMAGSILTGERIRLEYGSGPVWLSDARTSIWATPVDAEYPNWQSLIPTGRPKATTVIDAATLAGDISRLPVEPEILVEASGSTMNLTGTGRPDAEVTVTGSETDGSVRVAFNPKRLHSAAKAFGKGPIKMEWAGPQRPVVVRSTGSSMLILLMPNRVGGAHVSPTSAVA